MFEINRPPGTQGPRITRPPWVAPVPPGARLEGEHVTVVEDRRAALEHLGAAKGRAVTRDALGEPWKPTVAG